MSDYKLIFEDTKIMIYSCVYCGYTMQMIIEKNKNKPRSFQVVTSVNSLAQLESIITTLIFVYGNSPISGHFFNERGNIVLQFQTQEDVNKFCDKYSYVYATYGL